MLTCLLPYFPFIPCNNRVVIPNFMASKLIGVFLFLNIVASSVIFLDFTATASVPSSSNMSGAGGWNKSSFDTTAALLVSDNGQYAWKFYADRLNASRRFLTVMSIRFNNTVVVWTANRDHPVSANATLYLHPRNRSLILQDVDGFVAWSADSSTNIRMAHMNDTGNLMLLSSGGATVLWQSFDHPTDTLLPGQRLRTGVTLWSSLSPESPTRGNYSLKVEVGGGVLYASLDGISQAKIPYWLESYTSSADSFQGVLHSVCNRTEIVYSPDGTSLRLEQQGGLVTPQCAKLNSGYDPVHSIQVAGNRSAIEYFVFMKLDPDGGIRPYYQSQNSKSVQNNNYLYSGGLIQECNLPAYCGSYGLCSQPANNEGSCSCPGTDLDFRPANLSDPRQGCVLVSPLQNCTELANTSSGSSTIYQMFVLQGADYYANKYLNPTTASTSSEECKASCLSNCSCVASFFNDNTRNCFQYGKINTLQYNVNPSVTAFLKVKAQASPRHNLVVWLSTAVSAFLVIAVFVIVMIVRILILTTPSEDDAFLESLPGLPPRFSYKELQAATHNFSTSLGSGASGKVFRGVLRDGMEVAVKQLQITGESHGSKQFRAEVATLGNINHINLVQLRGFCAEGSHRLLVYEYVSKGSLDRWIFASTSTEEQQRPNLSCETRYKIAVDIARGLAFLHDESREAVMHLDVKPQNILLDEAFNAKLADFGLSKLMDRGQSRTVTAMRGTPGYMAPEWFLNMPVTDRSDVFSYGMVLLEMVGGRKNLVLSVTTDEWYFPAWAVQQATKGRVMDVVDRQLLLADVNEKAIQRLLDVAFWCIQDDASSRPGMSALLHMLEGHAAVPRPPLEMTYGFRTHHHHRKRPALQQPPTPWQQQDLSLL